MLLVVTRPRVLIIEDDEAVGDMLSTALRAEGYAVERIEAALGALPLARLLEPHAVVLDLGLPYRSGASLLAELKAHRDTAGIPVVVVSGLAEVLPPHRRALAAAVLKKPVDLEDLLEAVRAAVLARRGPGGRPPRFTRPLVNRRRPLAATRRRFRAFGAETSP
jgi:DNA-binding response OmpR family regulator